MKKQFLLCGTFAAVTSFALTANTASADLISFDYGETAFGATAAGPLGSDDVWNQVNAGSETFEGISLSNGAGSSDLVGGALGGSIENDPAPVTVVSTLLADDIRNDMHSGKTGQNRAFGTVILLDPGTYTIAATFGFSSTADSGQSVYMGRTTLTSKNGADPSDLLTGFVSAGYANFDASLTSWTDGSGGGAWNYLEGTFTVADGESILIYADVAGLANDSNTVGITSVQIIPEPASLALLGLGGLCLLSGRRK